MEHLTQVSQYSRVLENADPRSGLVRIAKGGAVRYEPAQDLGASRRMRFNEIICDTQDFLNSAKNAQGVSMREKVREIRHLDRALCSYESKFHSKGLKKAFHWLLKIIPGTCAFKVRKLHNDISSCFIFKQMDGIEKAVASREKNLGERVSSTPNRLQQIYARMAHRWEKKVEALEGSNQFVTMLTVLQELRDASRDDKTYTEDDRKQLSEAAEQLEFATKIAASSSRQFQEDFHKDQANKYLSALRELFPFGSRKIREEKARSMIEDLAPELAQHPELGIETAHEIVDRIEKLEEGESILIPGGYSTFKDASSGTFSGHAMLYEIKRTGPDTYAFEVINTGAGVGLHHEAGDNDYVDLWILGKVQISMTRTKNVLYNDLSLDSLSSSFLKGLIDFHAMVRQDNTVRNLYTYIAEHLAKNDGANITTGREHKIQKKGICAWKVISTWLAGKLDPKLHAKYKRELGKKDIQDLTMMKGSSPQDLPIDQTELKELWKCAMIKQKRRAEKLERVMREKVRVDEGEEEKHPEPPSMGQMATKIMTAPLAYIFPDTFGKE